MPPSLYFGGRVVCLLYRNFFSFQEPILIPFCSFSFKGSRVICVLSLCSLVRFSVGGGGFLFLVPGFPSPHQCPRSFCRRACVCWGGGLPSSLWLP